MSRREGLARVQDAALAAGATAVEVVGGGRHPVALLIHLPSGGRVRFPVPNRIGKGRAASRDNVVAAVRRVVAQSTSNSR